MRPIPIPDDHIWPGAVRRVVMPPGGDPTNEEISPVEAVVDIVTMMGEPTKRYHMLIQLEPGDVEKMAKFGNRFWVVMYGVVVPFHVSLPEYMEMFDTDFEGGDATGIPSGVTEPWLRRTTNARWFYGWTRNSGGQVIVRSQFKARLGGPWRWYETFDEELISEILRLEGYP